MLDANGRSIELGDHITLAGAEVSIVGKVIEIFNDDGQGFVALKDGLVFHDFEVESWGGYEWVRCQSCCGTWPLDVRINYDECPFCGALFHAEAPPISEMALHDGQLAEFQFGTQLA